MHFNSAWRSFQPQKDGNGNTQSRKRSFECISHWRWSDVLTMPAGAMAMKGDDFGGVRSEGVKALSLMEDALAALDRGEISAEVGAHLDLAICRLREVLGMTSGEEQLDRSFEFNPSVEQQQRST